ncbi:hypothetical protein GCM10020258_01480 [Sphingomonas yabuuchiae]
MRSGFGRGGSGDTRYSDQTGAQDSKKFHNALLPVIRLSASMGEDWRIADDRSLNPFVINGSGKPDCHIGQLLGHNNLAGEAAGAGGVGDQIEHVFLFRRWRGEMSEIFRGIRTWHVAQAICPPHVPSSGCPARCPTRSSVSPGWASAKVVLPSGA